MAEEIDHDDRCPICHLLLYKPVVTSCNHTACSSCMAHWAEVSITEQFIAVSFGVEDDTSDNELNQVEVKCPMCRTLTTTSADDEKERELRERHAEEYNDRAREEVEHHDGEEVIVMNLFVGNRHELLEVEEDEPNRHEWEYFVRPSRTDIIEEVVIKLHPTFRPPEVVRRRAPYEINRLGWGTFVITSHVVLKHGWTWISSDEQKVSGKGNSFLPIDWMLSFDGDGMQGKARLKIKRERRARNRGKVG